MLKIEKLLYRDPWVNNETLEDYINRSYPSFSIDVRGSAVDLKGDLLEPQLKLPIKNVWTRNVAKNLSGSKASRTAIFDLHCKDDAGDLIEIEVQIREVNNFMKRLAFYASEMVANQAEPGQDWDYDIQVVFLPLPEPAQGTS